MLGLWREALSDALSVLRDFANSASLPAEIVMIGLENK
jgi:hypothetical protein